ncbi:hypothetical protein JL49_02680 [Pseudoalteromonas luteoviolacea]|nr:hypothetical protein JL49_02680 [Pseudoalteromonas luteoviolacea]
MTVEHLTHLSTSNQNALTKLLGCCIDSGASLGFYKESESNILTKYWQSVNRELENKLRLLYILYDNNEVQATVQLALCHKQNGRHRAEVEKLLVQPRAHRKGYATKLMAYVESHALKQGIQLLVLDTQSGDKAELFYQASGYTKVGQIPNYVSDQEGRFHSTSYYYKHLKLED